MKRLGDSHLSYLPFQNCILCSVITCFITAKHSPQTSRQKFGYVVVFFYTSPISRCILLSKSNFEKPNDTYVDTEHCDTEREYF